MAAALEYADRQPLIDAVRKAMYDLVESGHKDDMCFIVGMGLIFLLTGEDGYFASDDSIMIWGVHPTALKADLFNDLNEIWQGLHGGDLQEGQEIIETIADAFMAAYQMEAA